MGSTRSPHPLLVFPEKGLGMCYTWRTGFLLWGNRIWWNSPLETQPGKNIADIMYYRVKLCKRPCIGMHCYRMTTYVPKSRVRIRRSYGMHRCSESCINYAYTTFGFTGNCVIKAIYGAPKMRRINKPEQHETFHECMTIIHVYIM